MSDPSVKNDFHVVWPYRAIKITLGTQSIRELAHEFGWWGVLWGTDIFINNVPLLKTIMLVNGIVLVTVLLLIVAR